MKKTLLFGTFATGMVMLSACSNEETVINGNDDAKQQIVLQVASSGDGITRAGRPLQSSEAKQSIENVKVIICGKDDQKIKFVTSVSDWNTSASEYTTGGHGKEKTIEIPAASKLPAGDYTVYAFGYSNNTDYDLSDITIADGTTTGTFSENTKLAFKTGATNILGEEIFAGSYPLTVTDGQGFKSPVVLNRQVAGTFGYLTDIPYIAKAAKLRLVASTRNTELVLGNFANIDLPSNGGNDAANVKYVVNGATPVTTDADKVIYTINLSDWFTTIADADGDGLIDKGNWKGDAKKYAEGSVFAGEFLIPFQKVDNTNTFELQLTDANDKVLRTWTIKLPTAQISTTLNAWNGTTGFEAVTGYKEDTYSYSVVRNHLYGIGERAKDEPTNPGNPDPDNPDKPQSLNNKQELTLRVNDNWEVIHKMEIE